MAIKYYLQRIGRPRFSIGSLMWLSLVVAIIVLWYLDHQRLMIRLAFNVGQTKGKSWSIDQVRGAPNTVPFADTGTAWASESQNGNIEWIIAEFPTAKNVATIHIYETYNPGALFKITSVSMTGGENVLWEGSDPVSLNSAPLGVAEIKLRHVVRTRRIKLYLNSPAVNGWNEIDAIALLDEHGQSQWASDAWASSSYGVNREPPSWYWP